MNEQQLVVTCRECGTESRHIAYAVLTRTACCWVCGRQLIEECQAWGKHFDEANAFGIWAEVVLAIEDRLGIAYPGIPDGKVFGTKPHVQLTLQDMVATIMDHAIPDREAAVRMVLAAATEVAQRPVLETDLDRPILDALGEKQWSVG